jgi:flagellar protein FliL
MTAAAAASSGDQAEDARPRKGGKKRLIVLLALPLLLGGIGAGLWFGGILPPLLGIAPKAEEAHGGGHGGAAADGHGAAAHGHGAAEPKTAGKADAKPAPVFMELPEIIANLNAGPRRNSFIKLRPKLELARAEDEAAIRAAMPRLLDLFQTYLREMRPEELRGSAGTWRLREELVARANIAVAPVRILDVLFPEMIVQ